MADETWAIAAAFGTQSALGTVNSTIAALSGTVDETDGFVLGDRDSGDAESGITVPEIARVEASVADVSGSFTRQSGSFERATPSTLEITWQIKGNGTTATPAVGEAIFDPGIHAILQMAGLAGANGGSNAEYDYTPSSSTTYGTIKLWVADRSYVFQDCIAESLDLIFEGGKIGKARATIQIGSHSPSTQFSDGVTFPTVTYGNQSSLSAPLAQGLSHTYGAARDFETLTIRISNEIEELPASNQATGVRKVQNSRTIEVEGVLYAVTADSDFDYQAVVNGSAPTSDLTFQIGTAATGATALNAFLVNANNVQLTSARDVKRGTVLATEIAGYCTGTTAGSEFLLQPN